jgi:hypothetical protein
MVIDNKFPELWEVDWLKEGHKIERIKCPHCGEDQNIPLLEPSFNPIELHIFCRKCLMMFIKIVLPIANIMR